MADKSKGQAFLERLEKFFSWYLFTADPDLPLVLAVWAVGSWVFERFYTWPYLVVTASVKGAGKSRVLELMKCVTRNPFYGVSPSPPFVLREIKRLGGLFTLLWDEAEAAAASDAKSFFSEVMNSGYRKGQEIGRAKGPDETVRYPSYCPKAFAMIGDPTGTIRDRSIIAEMTRGDAEREYDPEIAEGEGVALQGDLERLINRDDMGGLVARPPKWLATRDKEIWGSMFGLAEWLKVDAATMKRLERFAADNVAGKTAAKRSSTSMEDEEGVITATFAERAVRDLAAVFRDGEKAIKSTEAVERMMAITTGPWRAFRGEPLTVEKLAHLVRRLGVQSKMVRLGSRQSGGKTARCYVKGDVLASVPATRKGE